ncbi:MAG: AMP-binding protein, partial [Polaromonas sp.]|nr:AMP-binding protein [Polaromonas sp.]
MKRPSVIHKEAGKHGHVPNWTAYEDERGRFSWNLARLALQGMPGGGLNMGFEAVDRHATGVLRYHTALRFVSRDAPALELSYAALARQTNRFANVLKDLGMGKGDRLFLLAGRIPELYVGLLGALKNGSVVTPLFSAFGPEPIATRIQLGAGQVLLTTDTLYQRKVRQIRAQMPSLRHVLLVADDGGVTDEPDTLDLATLMATASDCFSTVETTEEDPALLFFTSGTTGTPKGALHVHGAVVA